MVLRTTGTLALSSVQRLNYGVVFQERGEIMMSTEYWLHTFQLPLPEFVNMPSIGQCQKDANTCLVINHVLAQINQVRVETAERLNSTLEMIDSLVPEHSVSNKKKRSLLPFIGQFSRTLFGTATVDDVNMLAKHINALVVKDNSLSKAFSQHLDHFSSYVSHANSRMDNLMKGIKENEIAFKFLHGQITKNMNTLQENFEYMLSVLFDQITSAEKVRNILNNLQNAVIDLINGKLSPVLIPSDVLESALTNIQKILDEKYNGFHLTHTDPDEIYKSSKFVFAKKDNSLFITLKLPITSFKHTLQLFKIISLPVPINETSTHATQILNVPDYFVISSDHQFYLTLAEYELLACQGKDFVKCSFSKSLVPITKLTCPLVLFSNNRDKVRELCEFRFMPDLIQQSIHEVDFNTLLVYRTPVLNLECKGDHKVVQGCNFCIFTVPCQCSLLTTDFYFPPRLMKCSEGSDEISIAHPFNLVLLQHFFDSTVYDKLFADSSFRKPLNFSIPNFQIYQHEMHDIIVSDAKEHYNLSKMVTLAKQDSVAFKSLSEPLIDGFINIGGNWPDINGILVLICLPVSVVCFLLSLYLLFKFHKAAPYILMLQQGKFAKAMEPTVPSFVYQTVNKDQENNSQIFNLDIVISWEHAILFFTILNLVVLLYNIWRFNFWQRNSKLLLEITSASECVLVPLMKLPMCASTIQINMPIDVSNIQVNGLLFKTLSLNFQDFEIVDRVNDRAIPVPDLAPLSFFQSRKLSRILARPFQTFVYVQHNGFLHRVKPN